MCGVYFSTQNESAGSDNKFLIRGPDLFNQKKINDFCFEHSLLGLTGEFTPQPISKNKVHLMFNGQIYNYDANKYSSDSYFILDEYILNDEKFFKNLDGEYAVVIYDQNKQIVIFLTDIFGTKPLFYSCDDDSLSVSSLKSSLEINNNFNIVKCTPNTIYKYDLQSKKLTKVEEYFKFNTDQYKESFDDWNDLFIKSVSKRFSNLKHDIVLPLSSGHDSGAIACAFDLLNINYFTYSIFNNEHKKILLRRLLKRIMIAPYKTRFKNKLSKEQKKINQSHLDFNSDNFYYGPDIDNLKIDGKKDPGAIGLSHVLRETSKLCENLKIVASGQGGDEIYSNNQDYSFGKPNPYKFPDDLELVFPWENFYHGAQMSYLSKEESIGGSYGLETRYPFLDKYLVQEYLNLSPELKNQTYKSPITNFLNIHKYPYRQGSEKTGFNP